MYTIKEAEAKIQEIIKSVEHNNDTIKLNTLIEWFNKNCSKMSYTEQPWDSHDTTRSYTVWAISTYNYGKPERKKIDDIIKEIVELNKTK